MKKIFLNVALMSALLAGGMSLTSCGEDDPLDLGGQDINDFVDTKNLVVKANAENGGSIEISGSVSSGQKIQIFGLWEVTLKGKKEKETLTPAKDMLKSLTKEKNEDGKTFTAEVTPTSVPVADAAGYLMYIKTKGTGVYEQELGKAYTTIPVGLGSKCKDIGSYISFSTGNVYKISDLIEDDKVTVKDAEKLASVEAIINTDGKLAAASTAINQAIAKNCGKSFLKDNVVITKSGTIATCNLGAEKEDGSADITGVRITSDPKGFQVTTEGYNFSK